MSTFRRLESEVRGYSRSFPTVFTKAQNATMEDEQGRTYIDFFAGAGALNYGHNNPHIKPKVIEYLENDGILHGLDMHTAAKREFLETFEKTILWPLEQDYKVQFTGPTGTNAVEAAFKLARRVTGRTNIISFTNGFHGMTLGAVAASGNLGVREASGVPMTHTTFMPYDQYLGEDVDTLAYLEKFLTDQASGVEKPAAIVVETVQGEGGVNVASFEWLRGLQRICHEHEILLIIDDIQVGCGRTGTFFSFEEAGLNPDMVTLSKSLGAYGLPMAITLMRSDLDQWNPGEHTGTFRGNNLAFVAATEALRLYWRDNKFTQQVKAKGRIMGQRLQEMADSHPEAEIEVRGRGMVWGIDCSAVDGLADAIGAAAFERGLIVETTGAEDAVIKLLPPLTIEEEQLERGLQLLAESAQAVLSDKAFREQHNLTTS